MNLLIVAATFFEISPFLAKLSRIESKNDQLSAYYFKNTAVDVLIPGVGMVQTAFFMGRQLAQKKYDLAVNAGIAGTFKKSLSLGSVVNVVEDCIPELGAEDGKNFLSVFDLGLADPNTHPYKNGRLINDALEPGGWNNLEAIRNLPKVIAITSNTVRGSASSIERIRRISVADIESMEGAAFFFACFNEKIPCLQIRSISNLVEERDKSRWNLDLALKNLNRALLEIVTSLQGND